MGHIFCLIYESWDSLLICFQHYRFSDGHFKFLECTLVELSWSFATRFSTIAKLTGWTMTWSWPSWRQASVLLMVLSKFNLMSRNFSDFIEATAKNWTRQRQCLSEPSWENYLYKAAIGHLNLQYLRIHLLLRMTNEYFLVTFYTISIITRKLLEVFELKLEGLRGLNSSAAPVAIQLAYSD